MLFCEIYKKLFHDLLSYCLKYSHQKYIIDSILISNTEVNGMESDPSGAGGNSSHIGFKMIQFANYTIKGFLSGCICHTVNLSVTI